MERNTRASTIRIPMRLSTTIQSIKQSLRLQHAGNRETESLTIDWCELLHSSHNQSSDFRSKVFEVWKECSKGCDGFPESGSFGTFGRQINSIYCSDFRWDFDASKIPDSQRQVKLEALAADLVALASRPNGHFEYLDERFSKQLLGHFESDVPEEVIVDRACQILERLPRTAPQVNLNNRLWTKSPGIVWPEAYFIESSLEGIGPSRDSSCLEFPWESLKVVSMMSTSTIRLVLLIAITRGSPTNAAHTMHAFLNLISELLDLADSPPTAGNESTGHGRYVLLAYLWTNWQRSMLLLFYYVLGSELQSGYKEEWADTLALRGNTVLGLASVRTTLHGWANQKSDYMCTWAFELLKTSRSSLGLDFRTLHQRFAAIHGNRPARCLFDSDEPCDGSHPLSCGRFVDRRLVAGEQSMHNFTCAGDCGRMTWDESSYRAISGARAVSLSRSSTAIRYCNVSEDTMAISHVWSHGQGGRPSTGINRCLHHRYMALAKQHGCSSYWIDTVCIPEAHDLRKEAISYINRIFNDSKVTVVCDKDLMSIDLCNAGNAESEVELWESILATFLVCDWNVRAWTLLEAIRGNHSLHLLCKHNKTLSLLEALRHIHRVGSIDLIVLFLAARHLLPHSTEAFRKNQDRQSVDYAGSLLSHRHATRDGDDIVIWSLLSRGPVSFTAEAMWKNRVKSRLKTGYLMTRTERVRDVRGFSWAPSSPYVRRSSHAAEGYFLAFDGEGSEVGRITAKGLRAIWLVFDVEDALSMTYQDVPIRITTKKSDGTDSIETFPGHRQQNECWQAAITLLESHKWVRLLHPKSSKSAEPYRANKDRGETHGPLMVVCSADKYDEEDMQWSWKGVYEWPRSLPLPQFALDDMLLV